MFGPVEVKHFPEVAAAGFEILRHTASREELKRYLRKQQDRQLTAEDAELVTFELVYLLAEQVQQLPWPPYACNSMTPLACLDYMWTAATIEQRMQNVMCLCRASTRMHMMC